MKFVGILLVAIFAVTYTYAAPSPLEEKLRALQEQLNTIEKESEVQRGSAQQQPLVGFQPQKRMVAWQPMKRSLDESRTPLVHAIEARLAEVLRAGERLGVNPEEVLADLRSKNQFQ